MKNYKIFIVDALFLYCVFCEMFNRSREWTLFIVLFEWNLGTLAFKSREWFIKISKVLLSHFLCHIGHCFTCDLLVFYINIAPFVIKWMVFYWNPIKLRDTIIHRALRNLLKLPIKSLLGRSLHLNAHNYYYYANTYPEI